MSDRETTPQPEEFDFSHHDKLFTDPVLEGEMTVARRANDYLATDSTISEHEVRTIVSGMDERWPYSHHPLRVTGKVVYVDPVLDKMRATVVSDKILISEGWTRETIAHMKDGRLLRPYEVDQDDPSLKSQIDFLTNRIVYYFVEPDGPGRFMADVDDVVIEPNSYSLEYVSNVLHYAHPKEMMAIDELMARGDCAEDRIALLQTFTLSVSRNDGEMIVFTEQVGEYLGAQLEVDRELPYECVVAGPVYEDTEDGEYPMDVADGEVFPMLVQINDVVPSYEVHPRINNYFLVTFDVRGTLHAASGSMKIIFPLNSIIECRSMRTKFYMRTAAKKFKKYSEVEGDKS